MKIAVFSTKSHDREFLDRANQQYGFEMVYFEPHLNGLTCQLAFDCDAVCAFVNDQLNRDVLTQLAAHGTKLVALRCAGFNNVDLVAARDADVRVVRVPAYSPHGVAEHAVALILALNRKIYRAYNRVREGNFSLEGLLGFELYGLTTGIIGTGKIGAAMARIMLGFGCRVLAYDPYPNDECRTMGVEYIAPDELFRASDIVTLHLPLTHETYHLIDERAVELMKPGVMLINTSRGGLVKTPAVIDGLKTGKIAYLGLDVYEEEAHLFFEDLSGKVLQDDTFARLLTFPNVLITGHQAFFTQNALANIAETTLANIRAFQEGRIPPKNEVTTDLLQAKS